MAQLSIILYDDKSHEIKKFLQQNTGITSGKTIQTAPLWDRAWILENLKNKIIELNPALILYNKHNSIIALTSVLPTYWYNTHIVANALHFYKISSVQTLTFTPIQSFTRFLLRQRLEAGFVQGPNSDKLHAVVLLENTQYAVGFMASTKKLTRSAGVISQDTHTTYINPNIAMDKTKIKYLPDKYSYIARTLAFYMHVSGNKPLLTNPDNIKHVFFKTSNFSNLNFRTQKWGPINPVHTIQTREKLSLAHTYQPFKPLENEFQIGTATSLHNGLKKSTKNSKTKQRSEIWSLEERIQYLLKNPETIQQPEDLSLEQHSKCLIDEYYPYWTSKEQNVATEHWLDPSKNCWFRDIFHEHLWTFLHHANNS